MLTLATAGLQNQILAALSPQDFATLEPNLETVELPRRHLLARRSRRIDHVYFLDTGVASVVAGAATADGVEIGMIGREGMAGLAVVMGAERAPYDTIMRVAGEGRRLSAPLFQRAFDASAELRRVLLSYAHAFSIQTAQTALSNARRTLEERLARWLLMTHDRLDGDEIEITHDVLAAMLGARRAGVTIALRHLMQSGLVDGRRGAIAIMDRAGLEAMSNGGYGAAEAELRQPLRAS